MRYITSSGWVKVRMLDSGRTFQVSADRAKWEEFRENDPVKVM